MPEVQLGDGHPQRSPRTWMSDRPSRLEDGLEAKPRLHACSRSEVLLHCEVCVPHHAAQRRDQALLHLVNTTMTKGEGIKDHEGRNLGPPPSALLWPGEPRRCAAAHLGSGRRPPSSCGGTSAAFQAPDRTPAFTRSTSWETFSARVIGRPPPSPCTPRPRDHKRTAGQPETPAWMDAFRIRRQYCQKTVCRCAYPLHACRAFHNTGLLFGKELHRVLVQVRPEAKNHEPYTVTSYLIVMLSLQHIRAFTA